MLLFCVSFFYCVVCYLVPILKSNTAVVFEPLRLGVSTIQSVVQSPSCYNVDDVPKSVDNYLGSNIYAHIVSRIPHGQKSSNRVRALVVDVNVAVAVVEALVC